MLNIKNKKKEYPLLHGSLGALYSFPTPPYFVFLVFWVFFCSTPTSMNISISLVPSDIMSHNNLTEKREMNKHLQKVLNLEHGWEYILISAPSH